MTIDTPQSIDSYWNHWQRILFRFICVYFLLYMIPFPLSYIPGISLLARYWAEFQELWVTWISTSFLGFTEPLDSAPNGSGDRLYNYAVFFASLVVSVLGCLIWTAIDFRRKSYSKLLRYLSMYMRYYLAFTLTSYGFSKVFVLQFSEMSLMDLIKPYGDSSPMALVWNYMEYSDSYTMFSGWAEVIAGFLLLFRRTSTLGALMAFGVMLNVFMMNMSYDVPVKLYSGHLMLIGLILMILDRKRLINFFLLNKSTAAKNVARYFKKKEWNIVGWSFKGMFILYVLIMQVSNSYSSQSRYGKKAPKPALYGIYEVTQFVKNNDTLLPLTTDSNRWDKLVIEKYYSAVINMDGSRETFKAVEDTIQNSLVLSGYNEDSSEYYHEFTYQLQDSLFVLKGTNQNDTLEITFKRKLREDYLLMSRGFNWVNDVPFNR